MKPSSYNLARRDTAMAAALGILPHGGAHGHYGVDVGMNIGFGGAYPYMGFGADPMASPHGAGAAAGAPASPAAAMVAHQAAQHIANPAHPAHQQATQAILAKHYSEQAVTHSRVSLLTPNAGSKVDVQRYDFSVPCAAGALVIGAAAGTINGMTLQPSTTIRPQRGVFNAPTFAFVTVTNILVGNVNGMVGGATDAFIYGPGSQGVHLDLPSINPSNRLQVQCAYTGLVPPIFPIGFAYPFVASFQCPATTVPNPALLV
jgi:hypothetical protein